MQKNFDTLGIEVQVEHLIKVALCALMSLQAPVKPAPGKTAAAPAAAAESSSEDSSSEDEAPPCKKPKAGLFVIKEVICW